MTPAMDAPQQPDFFKWMAYDAAGELILDELDTEAPCQHPNGPHPARRHAAACLGDLDRVRQFSWLPRGVFPGVRGHLLIIPPGRRVVFFRRRSFDKDLTTGEYSNPRTILAFGHEDPIAGEGSREVRFINNQGVDITVAVQSAEGAGQ